MTQTCELATCVFMSMIYQNKSCLTLMRLCLSSVVLANPNITYFFGIVFIQNPCHTSWHVFRMALSIGFTWACS